MIRCKPKGMFSWDFFLEGEGHQGVLDFNWMSEQGHITADGIVYDIDKHGVLSRKWSLIRDGRTVAAIQKSNSFTRSFELTIEDKSFLIRAKSPFGRSFVFEEGDRTIGSMTPNYPFFRSATIKTIVPEMDFRTLAFAAWAVILNWRRSASADH